MSTQVIEHPRRILKHGDNAPLQFDFTNVMPSGSVIAPADVTVTITPATEVTVASPVTVSGLVVQAVFDTTGAVLGRPEYLVDLLAENAEGIKKHLFVVLVIHPPP